MAPPTQIAGSPFQTSWTAGLTKTIAVGAVGVGDVVVFLAATEDNTHTVSTPTNTAASPATVTWTARGSVFVGSRCGAAGYTGSVTVAGNLTISSSSATSSSRWGYVALVFASANHGGVGAVPAGANAAGTAPTLTATWTAGSLVACINGDWTAGAHGASRSYRTGAGTATEINYAENVGPGAYTTEAWYHADTGAGGSQAVGLSTPTQTWSLVAIEVLGTSAATVIPTLVMAPYQGAY